MLGRKSGEGFYLYPKGKKDKKGAKVLNPEAVSLIKSHQRADGKGSSMGTDVIQDRMMCRRAALPLVYFFGWWPRVGTGGGEGAGIVVSNRGLSRLGQWRGLYSVGTRGREVSCSSECVSNGNERYKQKHGVEGTRLKRRRDLEKGS